MFDVRDEQFLMLLFMMNAQNKNRLDFIQQLLITAGKQLIDMRINRCTVALSFVHCWARDQRAQIAPRHIASGPVVGIKEMSRRSSLGPISGQTLSQKKGL